MTVPLRKRIERSVRSALVRAFARLLGFVPLRPSLALATVVGHVGWRVAGKTRRQMLWREDPSTARAMLRTFKQGRPLGILIDQDTRVQSVFVPFFGRPAATPRGAADLALRFGAPVLAGWCRRRGPRAGDGHVVDFVEIPYDPDPSDRDAEAARLTVACTAALEAAVRATPAEWVWMHERWKTQPGPGGEAPQAKAVPKTAELSSR
jgi:KDO2-lipid IV(A) lauroyltransferase